MYYHKLFTPICILSRKPCIIYYLMGHNIYIFKYSYNICKHVRIIIQQGTVKQSYVISFKYENPSNNDEKRTEVNIFAEQQKPYLITMVLNVPIINIQYFVY